MTSIDTLNPRSVLTIPQRQAVQLLERAGWQLLAAEIDFGHNTARIEVKRHDGLLATFDARNGKASVTRERLEMATERTGREDFRAERLHVRFLGRDKFHMNKGSDSVRGALKSFADYIDANSIGGERKIARSSIALLMG